MVSEDSVDYKRMKQYGTVLKYGSKEHQLAMMEADVIISSHANNHTYSPFPDKMTKYFTGFLTAKRVFLQHGITKDDLSEWLHKLNKDLKIFVTASPYEYESIVKGKYGYDNGEIILSGFPRYDNLKDFSENYILYLPTWDSSVLKLEDGMPVYISLDIANKYVYEKQGILDTRIYNYEKALDMHSLDKREGLDLSEFHSSHSMTITGVNIVDEHIERWKVEDSYGAGPDEKPNGYYTINDNYFDKFTIDIIINKRYLTQEQRELLSQEPIEYDMDMEDQV